MFRQVICNEELVDRQTRRKNQKELGCFSKKKTSRILQLFSSFFTTKYALVVVKNGPFFDSVLKFSKCLKKRYFTAIFSC